MAQILLAEDNLVNQKVASRMLSRMGYDADIAGNAQAFGIRPTPFAEWVKPAFGD